MFGAKDSGKKRKNRQISRPLETPAREPTLDHEPGVRPGASAETSESSADVGLSVEDYANKSNLSEAEVWRMLRRGELLGRTQEGHLLVFGATSEPLAATADAVATESTPVEAPVELSPGPQPEATIDDLTFLPPLPDSDGKVTLSRHGASAGGYLALSGDRTASPELALLLDHLSLAKEENREILRMTQDSIKKISDMSDVMLEMKDQVLGAREAELLALKAQLAQRDSEMKKLKQQNEDLEMLAHTMAATQPKR